MCCRPVSSTAGLPSNANFQQSVMSGMSYGGYRLSLWERGTNVYVIQPCRETMVRLPPATLCPKCEFSMVKAVDSQLIPEHGVRLWRCSVCFHEYVE
ncbi:MAG: zinc ribbon domain of RPA12 subunit of RNA polymerase I [Circular genetic element sp.]|nr:MAG: zinc ribbon domain of RPA12 subunit of RNA polymerase I [Circular genetic element sp.]